MSETERRVEFVIPRLRAFFTPAVTAILILIVIGFAFISYAKDFTANYLALSAGGVLSGKIWQLVTYSFIETGGLPMLFDGLLLLFVGSLIERELKTGGFVLLWLVVSIFCGLLWVIVSRLAGANYFGLGTSPCVYGLIAAFGVIFRTRMFLAFFWMVQARYISWALIVVGIILSIPQPIMWIWVSGALVGYLYIKLWKRIEKASVNTGVQSGRRSFVDID